MECKKEHSCSSKPSKQHVRPMQLTSYHLGRI